MQRVKSFFPNAARIDIGYAQRMKYTRYAMVRYATVEEAFEGFRLAFKMDLGPRSLVIRFRRIRGNISLNTNDPDGKKASKRNRKDMLDEEAIASDGIASDSVTGCDLNPFTDDREAELHCSDDSNDSHYVIDDDISLNLGDIEDMPVLPIQIKAESPTNQNHPSDGEDGDTSLNIVNNHPVPTDSLLPLPIRIKQEPPGNLNILNDDSADNVSLNDVNCDTRPMDVIPVPIKQERLDNTIDMPSLPVTDTTTSTSLPCTSTEIKKEFDDDFSDDDYFDGNLSLHKLNIKTSLLIDNFIDMPLGDGDSASTFGDDEFLRQNNLEMDEDIPEKPYWEQDLVERKDFKVGTKLRVYTKFTFSLIVLLNRKRLTTLRNQMAVLMCRAA